MAVECWSLSLFVYCAGVPLCISADFLCTKHGWISEGKLDMGVRCSCWMVPEWALPKCCCVPLTCEVSLPCSKSLVFHCHIMSHQASWECSFALIRFHAVFDRTVLFSIVGARILCSSVPCHSFTKLDNCIQAVFDEELRSNMLKYRNFQWSFMKFGNLIYHFFWTKQSGCWVFDKKNNAELQNLHFAAPYWMKNRAHCWRVILWLILQQFPVVQVSCGSDEKAYQCVFELSMGCFWSIFHSSLMEIWSGSPKTRVSYNQFSFKWLKFVIKFLSAAQILDQVLVTWGWGTSHTDK